MKGNNMIEMNQATIIEAVQEYLDKRWTVGKQKVTSVKALKTGEYSPTFEVNLSEVSEDKS